MAEAGPSEQFTLVRPDAITVHRLEAKDAPIVAVTVFQDRAEITRVLETKLATGGGAAHEYVIRGLSSEVVTDSVRVNGKGRFTIHEVQYDKEWRTDGEGESKESVHAQLRRLRIEETAANRTIARIKEQRGVFTTYARTVATAGMSTQLPVGAAAAGTQFADIKTMSNVVEMLAEKTLKLDKELEEAEEALVIVRKKIQKAVDEQKRIAAKKTGYYSHNVHVILQPHETKSDSVTARVAVVYSVKGATWSPSYDCRVFGSENKMTLTYYGLVTQTTGEDWNNVQLTLSTASPAHGGKPPSIPTKIASFAPVFRQQTSARRRSSRGARVEKKTEQYMTQRNFAAAPMEDLALAGAAIEEAARAPTASVSTARVRRGFAAQFLIARPASVSSGRKPHKTCIGVISMEIKSMLYSVPALKQAAYYQATGVNTSAMPFLASPKVRCFFDGNFVCMTDIKKVISPGERFSTYVGIDEAVKVTHKEVRVRERREGFLLSSKKTVVEHAFVTTIKNTKDRRIKISIAQQLPRSTHEQIQISLQNPSPDDLEPPPDPNASPREEEEAGEGTLRVTLNPITNNVVWLITVEPGKTYKLPYEYTIRHPVDKPITVA